MTKLEGARMESVRFGWVPSGFFIGIERGSGRISDLGKRDFRVHRVYEIPIISQC